MGSARVGARAWIRDRPRSPPCQTNGAALGVDQAEAELAAVERRLHHRGKLAGAAELVTLARLTGSVVALDGLHQASVDGYWGSATTSALQRHYGTVVDGIVSHQWEPNVTANPALTSGWQCDETAQGSPMIRKLQEDLGTEVDGIFGGPDIYALQSKCGTVADGALWGPSPCVMEMQRRLNAGTW